MPAKTYNELIIQYSNEDGFLHYANEAEGAALDPSLDRKAAFEGFESGDVQILRFLNDQSYDTSKNSFCRVRCWPIFAQRKNTKISN